MAKTGRPPVGDKLRKVISVRLTDEEYDRLYQLAKLFDDPERQRGGGVTVLIRRAILSLTTQV